MTKKKHGTEPAQEELDQRGLQSPIRIRGKEDVPREDARRQGKFISLNDPDDLGNAPDRTERLISLGATDRMSPIHILYGDVADREGNKDWYYSKPRARDIATSKWLHDENYSKQDMLTYLEQELIRQRFRCPSKRGLWNWVKDCAPAHVRKGGRRSRN